MSLRSSVRVAAVPLALGIALALPHAAARAADPKAPAALPHAEDVLLAMSEYLAKAKGYSYHAEVEFDQVLPRGPKIRLSGAVDIAVSRPGSLHVDYRVYDKPGGLFGTPAAVERRTFAVDVMGGLTYSWVDVRLKVSRDPGGVFPPGGRTINGDNDWVAPYLGFRFTNDFTDHLRHETLLGIGAFGVGDAPNISWQATSQFSYAVSEHVALTAGYRALGFREPDLTTTFHGPMIGAAFRFSGGL